MKKFFLIVLVVFAVLVTGAYLVYDSIFPKAGPIKQLKLSEIDTIYIYNNNEIEIEMSDVEIEELFTYINVAEPTRRMSVNDYKELFEEVVKMTNDADGFGLFDQISEEDVEKAKWIACIIDCLNDVPLTRVEHIFEQKNIEFDVEEFYEENGWS